MQQTARKSSKGGRGQLLRSRMAEALGRSGLSQSALARATGVDRSTVSALLQPGKRAPSALFVAEAARTLGVTSDWLLGLSDRPETSEVQRSEAMAVVDAPRALFDDAVFGWHRDAAGYKIRHVPATLPDLLKSRDVVDWEYRETLGPGAEAAILAFEDQLGWLQGARSDYEIALPLHELAAFAAAEGYWAGLPGSIRLAQLRRLADLSRALYPSLRLYLFDARRVWSAPVTIFGPQRAVVYLGRHYLSFQDPGFIQAMSQHFDWLVRESSLSARDVPAYIDDLAAKVGI